MTFFRSRLAAAWLIAAGAAVSAPAAMAQDLELTITAHDDGHVSRHLRAHARVGDRAWYPSGVRVWPYDDGEKGKRSSAPPFK